MPQVCDFCKQTSPKHRTITSIEGFAQDIIVICETCTEDLIKRAMKQTHASYWNTDTGITSISEVIKVAIQAYLNGEYFGYN